jgi:HJR/Mrr/RecB family endonuclease
MVFDAYDRTEEAVESLDLRRPISRLELQTLIGTHKETVSGLYLAERQESTRILLPVLIDTTEVLARRLLKEPESIYQLPSRTFEELIAALLEDLGWNIQLTPATSDGGRDIVAVIPSEIGNLLCLVEVKRYRQDRKVGVGAVRQLYGTVTHEQASYGLLVTSSTFSREAERFEQAHRYRIGLKEFQDVLQWVRRYCREVPRALA